MSRYSLEPGARWSATSLAMSLAILLVPALLAGCGRGDPARETAAPSGSSVKIIAISPAPGELLRTGSTVRLKVDVSYTLSVESGQVDLVVQDAGGARLAGNLKVIRKGSGQVSLDAEFVVPKTGAIQVFTPLTAQGQGTTSTVDSRVFEVIGGQ